MLFFGKPCVQELLRQNEELELGLRIVSRAGAAAPSGDTIRVHLQFEFAVSNSHLAPLDHAPHSHAAISHPRWTN